MITGVVCICSRGLIHSRTMESVEKNLLYSRANREQWLIEFTHDLPIPDAQTAVTEQALRWQPEYILYVEEDNVLPVPILRDMRIAMASRQADVVVADYPLRNGTRSLQTRDSGEVMFGGMGCLLVKASVFGRIRKPWFDVNEYYFDAKTGDVEPRPGQSSYGGQDISFFVRLREAGIQPVRSPLDAGHLRLKVDPIVRTNHGCFEVIEL